MRKLLAIFGFTVAMIAASFGISPAASVEAAASCGQVVGTGPYVGSVRCTGLAYGELFRAQAVCNNGQTRYGPLKASGGISSVTCFDGVRYVVARVATYA